MNDKQEERSVSGMVPKTEADAFYSWVEERRLQKKGVLRAAIAVVQMLPPELLLLLMSGRFDEAEYVMRSLPPVPSVEELRAAVARRAAELNDALQNGLNNGGPQVPESRREVPPRNNAEEGG